MSNLYSYMVKFYKVMIILLSRKNEINGNMFFILLSAILMTSGEAQESEQGCDTAQLRMCTDKLPRDRTVGLPTTRQELDARCQIYQIGMPCMDEWMKRCLPTDSQKIIQQQIGGARALMRYLCANDTALRRDYLKEGKCWSLVSPDWSHCVNELQLAVQHITERSHQIVYFNKNTEVCCARDAFMSCVSLAGRACSADAALLLGRVAWVLAQDVAVCSAHPHAHCVAPLPPRAAQLLTALSTALLYLQRI